MYRDLCSITARLTLFVAVLGTASGVFAQGVTGAAITGTVTGEGKGPIEGASVQARHTGTGANFNGTTNASGEYFLDNLPAGGPYAVTARAAGLRPETETDVVLTLGERRKLDFELPAFGEEIVVVAPGNPLRDRGRTGASTALKSRQIEKLPLQRRNFTDLIQTNPQTTGTISGGEGSVSIAGQNNRFNNIQIDGGANNDLFGLSSSGTPGGNSSARPLSVEAIQEFVVQVSPFDVRYGNFAGGLVNAITKSGTNQYRGSIFGYNQNKALVGLRSPSDPNIAPINSFTTWQYGATLGGPIIKDKLHFFGAVDIQARTTTFGNQFQIPSQDPGAGAAQAGFTNATAQQFMDILGRYGITNQGDTSAPNLSNPDRNVFFKLSTSLIENSQLELSYNFVNASDSVLIRGPTTPSVPPGAIRLRDGYELSNAGYMISNSTNTVRAKLTTNWNNGKISNELLAGVSIIRDARDLPTRYPLILVDTGMKLGNADSWLAAGSERFSHANALDQDIYQIQDNLTFALDKHRLTVGTSNEYLRIRNLFLQAAYGAWGFASLADFANGNPAVFQRRLAPSDQYEAGTARFKVTQVGFYVQDEWSPLKNFVVTPGIRIDVPFLSSAPTNPVLVNNTSFPIDTSKVPSGNILWSPRLGFNWDVEGTAETVLRGGVGVFSGRPPYVWVSNAYSINGLTQIEVTCTSANGIPAFTPDPNAQPSNCLRPVAVSNQGEIDYFDPNTKYPQNLRAAVGFDKRLPWGLIGTLDFLYTRDINGWYTTDANLNNLGTNGEGRATYGTLGTTSTGLFSSSPSRIDPANLTNAVKVYNKNGAYVYSATLQLQKQFLQRYALSVAYTYSKSRDLISFTSSQAFSNFQFAPLDGTLSDRNARPSNFDRPHKVTVTGTAALPYGFLLGLSYVGQSGLPYTWTVSNDVNGDGVAGNDLVFVPNNPSQISLSGTTPDQQAAAYAALNDFINSQDCLRQARGRFIQRGECRNPWQSFVSMRFGWISPEIVKDQRLEVQLDIFNVLNLINSSWGLYSLATPFENHQSSFLTAVGFDAANNRPIYSFRAPTSVTSTIYSSTQSRWRLQLGARYLF
jgi:outer membrane receptor protein involved in Fe transport